MPQTVLIIEDDKVASTVLKRWLAAANFDVVVCDGVVAALAHLATSVPAAVLLDLGLPDGDGVQFAAELQRNHPNMPVLVVSGDGSAETAVRALQAGAADYLVKPVGPAVLLERLRDVMNARPWGGQPGADARDYDVEGLQGPSEVTRLVRQQVHLVAASRIDVAIHGETGTGKEIIARAIHAASPKPQGPFVAVNCAALSDSLIDSELFGHERHAFTGADRLHRGRVEQAAGGTLFLDEVAELSLTAQAKLLRVLQERRFHRVGGTTEILADFRLITATNRPLRRLVQEGKFRADLLFRMAVYEIELLPLRERREDILPIVDAFLLALPRPPGAPASRLPAADRQRMRDAEWPGNVREIHNVLRRALVHARPEGLVMLHLAPPAQRVAAPVQGPSWAPKSLRQAECDTLKAAVDHYRSDMVGMAAGLGLSRSSLYRKLADHDLRVHRE